MIYYIDSNCLSAGIITALSNRIGDMFFILGLALMRGSIRYGRFDVFISKSYLPCGLVMCLGSFIVFGRITKRAVIPFSA